MKTKWLGLIGATVLSVAISASAQPTAIVKQYMTSAKVDFAADTATLPLHLGFLKDGRKVWFVITDTSDAAQATALGLVHAPELASLASYSSTRTATVDSNGIFTFQAGTVDFGPVQTLVAGDSPNFFPPKKATPGSVGDAAYSPFVKVGSVVYNAPIVAFDVDASDISFCNGGVDYSLVHDRVEKICPSTMKVSIKLGHGFASGSPVIYLSFDSNNTLPATMESSTYTPATDDLKGSDATETLYAFANGATGVNNPDRQGFNSALSGEGSPLNILAGLSMNDSGYSPLWDVNVTAWTAAAIASGQRHLETSNGGVYTASQKGLLTNPMGGQIGTLGLLVNCPVIAFVK